MARDRPSGCARRETPARCVRLATGALLVAGLLVGAGCRAPFRLAVEPQDATHTPEERLLQGMNPFLLTNLVSHRVVVEVDHVAGVTAHPAALEGLRATLEAVLPEGKQIEIVQDEEIPIEVWQSAAGDFLDRAETLGPYMNRLGGGDDDAERIYVVYVPDQPEYLGWATRLVVERDGQPEPVDTILMFPLQIKRASELWITAKKIERAILIHELGHVLGLVSGVDHRERGNPRHCTEPQCVMTHPSARTKTYNALPAMFAGRIPHDYCGKCRSDIEAVRQLWREAAEQPGYVDALRRRRQVETLRAQACWFGKQRRFAEAAARLREARSLAGESTDGTPFTDDPNTLELLALCPAGEN